MTSDPLIRVGRTGQVTTPPASTPPLSAETKVTPAGRVSCTTTAVASEGPLFATVRVYQYVSEGATVGGPLLISATSAISVIVVVTRLPGSVPLLLVVSGSALAASA